jgi:exodeoxyribonuclease-3
MREYRILSWNINGLRALSGKKELLPDTSFSDLLKIETPDIVCLQETKAGSKDLPKNITRIPDYFFFLNSAERKGYSGVALYTRNEPELLEMGGLGPAFDNEGRIITARYADFILLNVYFPNGGASDERLDFKLKFYDAFLDKVTSLNRAGERLIICGDVNTAHTPDDIARPKENEKLSGFLPIEREWIDKLISAGFKDTFRLFCKEGGHYTWWDYKTHARTRNVGWRLDYFFVNERMLPFVTGAGIRSDVMGSDHCPVTLTINIPD